MRAERVFSGLIVVAVLVLAPVLADNNGAPGQSTVATLRTGAITGTFILATPDALSSSAARDNSAERDADGNAVANETGYTFSHRVVVRADDVIAAALQAEGTVSSLTPVVGAPGFWVETTASVAAAIALADRLAADPRVGEAYPDVESPRTLRLPTDPSFPQQWHLRNTSVPIADVNAEAAWNAGFTGAGVVIGIVEGGWQLDHPDLAPNYNAAASQAGGSVTSHATSCAGVAAAADNNGAGGVGVAYDAQLSKLVFGSAAQNATAFGFSNDLNQVKSNSWGPSDNGRITYLSSVERTAIENAIRTGRGGLGTILVWAAGNGATANDRVDYDPYASSRYTLAIGAIGDLDTRSWYNEVGSSMLAVTQSDGNSRSIYTTTTNGSYTGGFGGTSSASPLGAGTVALVLQANPNLGWRDVQHVLIESARQCDPANPGWSTNAAGHLISYDYGFGALDAGAATALAGSWTNVGPEILLDSGVQTVAAPIPDNNLTGLTRSAIVSSKIRVESVELVFDASTLFVGDLQITLTGPSGTNSVVARVRNDFTDNYTDYLFTSLRHWGETSDGTWSVNVYDGKTNDLATWNDWQLRIYGTRLCRADLSLDGVVSEADLGILLQAWQTNAQGDIDGDGATSESDLGVLLQEWASVCM